ncbi:MAG: radical SAM protein [Candidatus Krumholzibacteria bacterium]|nr:radical SAM protein [Candidatus Krumholzibacteria bacterium]
MIPRKILESASVKDLYRLMLENRLSRKALFGIVGRRLHRELVVENAEGRPRRVQELKHAYMMALFHGFDRAMTRGYVSRSVTERLLDTVLENVIVNEKHPVGPGPHPLLLVVSPTGRCNLRCEGCYAASESADRAGLTGLDFDIFDRIVTDKRRLWDSHLTIVSGGEPFLWRDGERGLLDLVERHPTEFFMIYTNGTLITDDLARRMAELGNISPALSLEGFEEETDARRGAGTFEKVLQAFERMRRHGVPFGVSVTPTSKNWDTVTSDRFIDFCFDAQGAVYAWCFQYMPIGSSPDLDLMVSPENRLEMLRRTNHLVRDKKVLFADFWNSGIASYGCISAGRAGGQFYIDWNGDVTPCVFVPYAVDNIYSVYERGDDLNALREAPFFRKIRAWQDEYGFKQSADKVQNWLCPCPIRDDFDRLRDAALETNARPINEAAADALVNPDFRRRMAACAGEFKKMSAPVWEMEFSDSATAEPAPRSKLSPGSGA